MSEQTKIARNTEWLECEDCHKKSATVEQTYCPYAEELYDKLVPATLCKDCYQERCWDI